MLVNHVFWCCYVRSIFPYIILIVTLFNASLQFQGSDILHIYNKQQVKTRLNAGTLYLANNKPSGFTIEVNNHHSGTVVMVGIRILIGFHSVEKAPSFVEVFGRTHTVCFPAGTSRWMDMPFTRDEALQADKELKINCEI